MANDYTLTTSGQPANTFTLAADGTARPKLFSAVADRSVFPCPVSRADSGTVSTYIFNSAAYGSSLLTAVRNWLANSGFNWSEV